MGFKNRKVEVNTRFVKLFEPFLKPTLCLQIFYREFTIKINNSQLIVFIDKRWWAVQGSYLRPAD